MLLGLNPRRSWFLPKVVAVPGVSMSTYLILMIQLQADPAPAGSFMVVFKTIASILAGLGLFFVGIKLLRDNLRQVAGPRFRLVLARVSDRVLLSSLWGSLTGFVTQSGRVTALLLSSLIAGGIMNVRQALPMVVWSNVGCSLIVVTAILPVNLLVLVVIGLGGICFAYDYPRQSKHLYSSLFGLALFMYGLGQIKLTSDGMMQLEVMKGFISLLHNFEPLAFVLGLVLTIIVQSHMGIILLVIALAESGTFSLPELALIIYGAHLGSSFVTWFFSIGSFQGSARQTLMGQVLYNVAGVLIFVPLAVIERVTDTALVLALVTWVSLQLSVLGQFISDVMSGATTTGEPVAAQSSITVSAAILTVLFNLTTAALLTVFQPLYLRLVESMYPASVHEVLAKPLYINDAFLDQPDAAAELVEKEQLRLLKRLPFFLDALRDDAHGHGFDGAFAPARTDDSADRQQKSQTENNPLDPHAYHEAFTAVSARLVEYTATLMASDLDRSTADRLMSLQARMSLIQTIELDTYLLAVKLGASGTAGEVASAVGLKSTLVEGLDTVLLTCISAAESLDHQETEMLQLMTCDKSSLIRNLRQKYLTSEARLKPEERLAVLESGNLFERLIWSIGRFSHLLEGRPVDRVAKG